MVKIHNLYIQRDDVSSNKYYTIMSSMTAFVACGICKKIKIHYLVVVHTHEDIDALTDNKFPPPLIIII